MRFADSDVYKWLEAVGWELGRAGRRARGADEIDRRSSRRPRSRGRLPQLLLPGRPARRRAFGNLAWDHELYCAGHLIQAAVAHARGARRRRGCWTSPAGSPTASCEGFGPDGDEGTPGHPEIETALVELYRQTGERALPGARRAASSTAAATARSQPGQVRLGLLPGPRAGARGDRGRGPRACARSTSPPASTDLYLETGEAALLDAMRARSGSDMAAAQDLPHRRARRAPHATRRSATRTSCRPTALRRDLRGDRLDHVELADAAGHRRGALRRPDRAHALQRLHRRARRSTAAATPTSTRCTSATATRPGGHGARAPAVVRVRLLPAERDADCWPRCTHYLATSDDGRHADPPVRERRRSRRPCDDRGTGLPVGRRVELEVTRRRRAGRWRCASRRGRRRAPGVDGDALVPAAPGYARVGAPGAPATASCSSSPWRRG